MDLQRGEERREPLRRHAAKDYLRNRDGVLPMTGCMTTEWHEYLAEAHRPSPEAESILKEVIDAAFVVHRELGPGFIESIYERSLAIELEQRGIPFERQRAVTVQFHGFVVGEHRLDFLVGGRVVVELKAQRELHAQHVTQVISYLRASRLDLGLVVNFGLPSLKAGLKRVVLAPRESPTFP